MLYALPEDGQRHEIIDGVHYVTPSPAMPHQVVLGELFAVLLAYLKRERVGWVILSPFDVDLGDDTVVEPDIVVFSRTGPHPPEASEGGVVPILAIEIISPSSVRRDRIIKRLRYQRAGIAEYWIVDSVSRLVERWLPTDDRPEIIVETLRWHPAGAATELSIDLSEIFADLPNDSGG